MYFCSLLLANNKQGWLLLAFNYQVYSSVVLVASPTAFVILVDAAEFEGSTGLLVVAGVLPLSLMLILDMADTLGLAAEGPSSPNISMGHSSFGPSPTHKCVGILVLVVVSGLDNFEILFLII